MAWHLPPVWSRPRAVQDRIDVLTLFRCGEQQITNRGGMDKPAAQHYLELFAAYGKDFGPAYLEPEDERYRLLFDQICHLLMQPSPFNLSMPQEFRVTAQRYLAGDRSTVAHLRNPQNRHFMLSDLYDYVHLWLHMGGPTW